MELSLQYKVYKRPFSTPLVTRYGKWDIREGIIVRLENEEGAIGFGEVAPIDWFKCDNLVELEKTLKQLPPRLDLNALNTLSLNAPLQFALESAHMQLMGWPIFKERKKALNNTALLPAGEQALEHIAHLIEQGYKTFKWKIGVEPLETELLIGKRLLEKLDDTSRLRLDANGGLDMVATERWLTDFNDSRVDYLEQPMPVGEEKAMAALSRKHKKPIALDESVTDIPTLDKLTKDFPRGPFVIKTSLIGSIKQFVEWRQRNPHVRLIYSSAFETSIGFQAGLLLASSDTQSEDAVGFGTMSSFSNDVFNVKHEPSALIDTEHLLQAPHFETLWNHLS